MDMNLIVTLILALAALALVVGGPIIVMRRAASLNSMQEAEAAAFEREMLAATRRGDAQKSAPPSPLPNPPPHPPRLGREYPAFGNAPKTQDPPLASTPSVASPIPPVSPPPVGPPAHTPAHSIGQPSPLASSVIEKLSVAGVFRSVEGPLRCANPEIRGTLISLKNGKRLGILDSAFDHSDPALEGLLRHLDGLIVAGPGGQPLFLKRFQDFLSDLMMP